MTRATGHASRWFEDGRFHFALGIEDTFVPQAREGERPIDEYELTEHYSRYLEDFALASASGAELLRWGVPWYKVSPQPGRWDWSWVDRAIDGIQGAGLTLVADLLHYGTPTWLADQFAHPDYPQHVEDFAARFADRYGNFVLDYTPVNEPVIHALFAGEYAYWPPYLSGARGFTTVAVNVAKGFVRTQTAIAGILSDATFVHVDAAMKFVGDIDGTEHAQEAQRLADQVYLVEDLVTGGVDEGHPLAAELRRHGFSDADLAWFVANAIRPDVMGVNYYPRHSTELFEKGVHHSGGFADPRPSIDRGADGLRDALETYAARYGAPVMVTETCVTGSVHERIAWLDESVALVNRMREEGTNIVGYTWWPLFDMYEWTWRHTDNPRRDHLLSMGLYDLVETDGGLLRSQNPVADRFRHHALSAHHSLATPNET